MDNCQWEYNECEDYYETNCGTGFYIAEGTLKENKYFYCPKCGRLIEVKE
jgi:hypothetical protein